METEGSQHTNQNANSNDAVIVFSAEVVQQLDRLEPTYVGVRRVRPSSRVVQKALLNGTSDSQSSIPGDDEYPDSQQRQQQLQADYSYTVIEDGVERRMTSQEKKAMRKQMLDQKKAFKQEQRRIREEQEERERMQRKLEKKRKRQEERYGKRINNNNDSSENEQAATASSAIALDTQIQEDSMKSLAQVGMSQKRSLLEQELADIRGERHGVPPVMLPASLVHATLASKRSVLPGGMVGSMKRCSALQCNSTIIVDDQMAREWAKELYESMMPALDVRGQEDMRPMAYDIIPDVWSRLRPTSLTAGELENKDVDLNDKAEDTRATNTSTIDNSSSSWTFTTIRPPSMSSFDNDLNIVAQVIYQQSNAYISCGAKFGCDFLLYDGPRKERHAFAGLRLVTPDEGSTLQGGSFPILSAYCIAGYVRCLNTAGKLALFATVKRDLQEDGAPIYRVAFLDLKLERIDGTKRKDMSAIVQKLKRSV